MSRAKLVSGFYGMVFVSLGLVKIISGYRENTFLSETTHYLLSTFEIILGVSFWTKYRKVSFPIAILFFSGSILFPFIVKYGGCGCGCFGKAFFLDKRTHIILSSFLGFFFSLGWFLSGTHSLSEKGKNRSKIMKKGIGRKDAVGP